MSQSVSIDADITRWKGLFKTAGAAALSVLVIMAAQIAIFILWPPPDSVEGFFALFQKSGLLGLLSLDLLYFLNNALIIPIYLALYMALKRSGESAVLVALVIGLVGIASYYASTAAFEMLALSGRYAAAATDAQRTVLLGAGEALLATYKGSAFDVYYVLNAVTLLVFSIVMLRSTVFSHATALWGLAAAVLMAIPSTAGTIGLIFSLASLVPWAVFSVLIARRFLQLAASAGR